jgi:hypothetical protein
MFSPTVSQGTSLKPKRGNNKFSFLYHATAGYVFFFGPHAWEQWSKK